MTKALASVTCVSKVYVSATALSQHSATFLSIFGAGEFITLLGPSGSGKTTTLKIVAGFLRPDSGRVILDGKDITDLPPHLRDIGMVFQNYALFPHLTVARNVAFPLEMRRMPKSEITRVVDQPSPSCSLLRSEIGARANYPGTAAACCTRARAGVPAKRFADG